MAALIIGSCLSAEATNYVLPGQGTFTWTTGSSGVLYCSGAGVCARVYPGDVIQFWGDGCWACWGQVTGWYKQIDPTNPSDTESECAIDIIEDPGYGE